MTIANNMMHRATEICNYILQIITSPCAFLSLLSNELYTADVLDFLEEQEDLAEPMSWEPPLYHFEVYVNEAAGG